MVQVSYVNLFSFSNCAIIFLLVLSIFFSFVIFKKITSDYVLYDEFSPCSSSLSGSSSPSGSSSSPDDKDPKSFWKKYWKIIVCSFAVVTVISSAILYYYYTKTVPVDTTRTDTYIGKTFVSTTKIASNKYYFTYWGSYIEHTRVVLKNPTAEQYAPFATHWHDIFKNSVSEGQYNMVFSIFKFDITDNLNRMVFNEESFRTFVSHVHKINV
jgi:hypothetical protein